MYLNNVNYVDKLLVETHYQIYTYLQSWKTLFSNIFTFANWWNLHQYFNSAIVNKIEWLYKINNFTNELSLTLSLAQLLH